MISTIASRMIVASPAAAEPAGWRGEPGDAAGVKAGSAVVVGCGWRHTPHRHHAVSVNGARVYAGALLRMHAAAGPGTATLGGAAGGGS